MFAQRFRPKGVPLSYQSSPILGQTSTSTDHFTFLPNMGLKMNSIHDPTISSQSSAKQNAPDGASDGTKPLLELIAEKDRVESELSALSGVLDSVRDDVM